MRIFKLGLRVWITVTSILSFLVGWVLLAHAPKPVQASTVSGGMLSAAPTLEPLPPLSNDGNSIQDNNFQFQPSFNNQPRFQARPFFSTGGS